LQPNGQGGKICFIVNGIPSDKKFLNTTGLTQQLMKTLQKQISLFGEEELTSSRVDFLANRTAQPESGLERKTSDTCGPKCLESFERFNHVGSWAKTFSALLIGTGDWYSTRCKLTWKLKGTKYNRLYFQLQASTLPTKGTEFGLLHTEQQHLLKTPTAMDGEVTSGKKNPVSGNSGTLAQEIMSGYKPTMEKLGLLPTPTTMDMLPPKTDKAWEKEMTETRPGRTMPSNLRDVPFRTGLLPTPIASDIHHAERVQKLKESGAETMASRKNGANRPNGLMDYLDFNQMLPTPTLQDARIGPNNIGGSQHRAERGSIALADIALGLVPTPQARDWKGESGGVQKGNDLPAIANKMLPTPTTRDYKGARSTEALENSGRNHTNSLPDSFSQTGKTSQLSPHFVLELMGFPPNFTELPFLSGETNQSKPPETPLCPK
jgi:hypothetical protein